MNKNQWIALCAVAAVLVLAACGGGGGETGTVVEETSQPATSAPAPAAGGGSIAGVVNYTNGDPDAPIKMDADPVCASLHTEPVETETIVADAGKLANVFVYVKEGAQGTYSPPGDAHVLNQIGCQYTPHVSGVMTGQKLLIRNSDQTLHNVHAMPENNEEFNQGQPFQGMELEKEFTTAEVMVRFKCDVHPWMGAYMAVLDHPFFTVSGADGSFEIDSLPAGDYVLEAWHETLGTLTQSVSVAADGTSGVTFDFASAG